VCLYQCGLLGGECLLTPPPNGSRVQGASASGGTGFGNQAQHVILPAVEGQDVFVGGVNGTAGIRFQDGIAALLSDLINAAGAVGGGVVAHGVQV